MMWECMKCGRLYEDNPRMCENCGYSIFSVDGQSDDPDALKRRADDSDTPLAESVVNVIANVKGVDPLDIPPLYDSVDLDAVEALLEDTDTQQIQFRHAGFDVVVTSSGDIKINSNGDPTDHT